MIPWIFRFISGEMIRDGDYASEIIVCSMDRWPVTVNPFFLCWRTSGAKVYKSAHQLVLVLVLGTDLEAYPNQADVSTKTQVSNCEVHIVFASLKHMLFLVLMKKEWLLWFLLMLRPTFPTLGLASTEYPHPTIQPPEGNPQKIFGESEIEVPFPKISDIFFWKKKDIWATACSRKCRICRAV